MRGYWVTLQPGNGEGAIDCDNRAFLADSPLVDPGD